MPTLIKHTREAVAVSEIYITLLAPVADVIRDRMGSGVNPSMEGPSWLTGKTWSDHSTTTAFTRLRGRSTSLPRCTDMK